MNFKEEASEPGFSVSSFEVGILLMAKSTSDCCGPEGGCAASGESGVWGKNAGSGWCKEAVGLA